MKYKIFKIIGTTIETVGLSGKEVFMIDSISPQGIKVLSQAKNGADIVEHISWNQIKK